MAVGTLAERIGREVDIHRAGQRIGHHKGRGGQVVGLDQWVDAAFEVAVAAQYGRHYQALLLHRLGDIVGQRTAIADARRAAEAHQVEIELLEVGHEAGLAIVIGHHLRPGSEAGLNPGLHFESAFDGLFCQQARGQHHAGVGSVGATGDRRDDHRAVTEGIRRGRRQVGKRGVKIILHPGQFDAILRALRTGHGRHNCGEIQFQGVGEDRVGCVVGAEEALFLGIGFHKSDQVGVAIRESEERERFLVDREESHSGPVLRRHVGDSGAVGQAERAQAGTVKLDEFADDALLAEHLRDGQDQICGGATFLEAAAQFEAHHGRQQHGNRLSEHARFGLDATHAPAKNAEAIDHRGMGIRADDGIRVDHDLADCGRPPGQGTPG